jgi:hypothetical protein
MALAQRRINIGPALVAILARCHEIIIHAGDQKDQNNRDADKDKYFHRYFSQQRPLAIA